MRCPKCKNRVRNKDINISDDVVFCTHCHAKFPPSESYEMRQKSHYDLDNPPDGAWIERKGNKIVIGASAKSPVALVIIPFLIIWTAWLLYALTKAEWDRMKITENLILTFSVLAIVAIVFWIYALIKVWGKVELTIDGDQGKAFTGLWNIGQTTRFNWQDINSVREGDAGFKFRREKRKTIVLQGKKNISLKFGLEQHRRHYIKMALISLKVVDNKSTHHI